MKLEDIKLAIIGLGYVGLPLAVEFGKHRDVIGFDINTKRISELEAGNDFTLEVSSTELASSTGLKFSSSVEHLSEANFFIITVPTPIDKNNTPDLTPLKNASLTISSALKKGDFVVFESTVYPGATEEICIPIIEEKSGLKLNVDFYAGYSPERINPGDKINTLTKIKKITSGSTEKAGILIDDLYRTIITAGTHRTSSIKVAEAAKVIENSQRDLNIAFVNELSIIFEKMSIDTIEVLEAAGTKWNFLPFRPGLVGGHCIGVDPYYLTHKAEELGYHPEVILAGRRINDNMPVNVANKIIKDLVKLGTTIKESKITIFGITFKDNCPDLRNSKVFDLVYELQSWGVNIQICDPWVRQEEQMSLPFTFLDIRDVCEQDAIVIAVAHDDFKKISRFDLDKMFKCNKYIADLKGVLDKKSFIDNDYIFYRM